jgi:hypothetical protein
MADAPQPTAKPAAAAASPQAQAPTAPSNTAARTPVAASPGAFNIAAMDAEEESSFLNILIYGKHGAGKTTLAGSATDVPEMRDVLVIAAEGGKVVFRNNPRIKNWKGLDVIKIDRIEQFQRVYAWIKEHLRWRDVGTPHAEEQLIGLQKAAGLPTDRVRKYRTVIVDSLSEIEEQNMAKILDLASTGLDAGDDMEVAGWPQFRKNKHIIMMAIRQFRDLEINVIMICGEKFDKDERSQYHYGPKMTGALRTEIQGPFDVVGWLVPAAASGTDSSAVPRRLFVQPQTAPKADAKCRLASYRQPFFDNPVMETIMTETGYIARSG